MFFFLFGDIIFSTISVFIYKKIKTVFFLLRVKCVCVAVCVCAVFFSCFVIYVWGLFQKWGKFSSVVNFIPVIDRGSSMGDFKCVYVCIDILSLSLS